MTAVLAALCIHNFDRGLKPYIQRGSEKKEQAKQQIQKEQSGAWIIDEE